MKCEEARDLISAYQDDELPADRSAVVAAHLESCPECSAILNRNLKLGRSIRELAPTYYPPEALAERLRHVIPSEAEGSRGSKTHTPRFQIAPFILGLAAGLLVAVAIGWLNFMNQGRDLTAALVSDHVRSLMANHLIDIPSSNRHVVKPWFLGKLDFSPSVPDLASQGFPLVGGRLDYVDGHAAAALVYNRGLHTINVFVMKTPGSSSATNLDGYHIERWHLGDLDYWAVSDLEFSQLNEFADDFRRAAS